MQIVGYDAGDGGLLLARDGDVEYVDLTPGTELTYQLGERHCAGVVDDGQHVACDAEAAPYCDAHSDVWV
ncbi:MAG: DUF2797 domain-containing protein, partial [Halolamina sp.]